MSSAVRLSALEKIESRTPVAVKPSESLETLWCENVFTLEKMKRALPKEVFKSVQRTIRENGKLDVGVANAFAQAM
jgi:glutamine synthetase